VTIEFNARAPKFIKRFFGLRQSDSGDSAQAAVAVAVVKLLENLPQFVA
jgi:hypothetical protein